MNRDCDRAPAPTRTRSFLSPHKFIGGPGHAGRARRPPRAADQPGARRRPAAARSPTSTRTEHRYLDRPGAPRGGRHAGDRRVDPRRAGLPAQGRRRASTTIRAHEEDYLRARGRRPGSEHPAIEILGNLDAERLSIVSFVDPARRAGATCTTTSWSPCSTTCSASSRRGGCSCAGPYGHRLLGIDLERSHEFEREITARLRGHQARLGAGQLQLLHLRGGLRLRRRGGRASSREHGWRLLPRLPLRPGHRPVAAPRRRRSSRRCASAQVALRRRRRDDLPAPRRPRAGVARWPSYLDEARRAARARLRRRRRPTPAGIVSRRLRAPALVRPAGGLPDLSWSASTWRPGRGRRRRRAPRPNG